ncbi:MAG: hypothetical protein R3D33_10790 [Hyphomicrobiaceae bacterium]
MGILLLLARAGGIMFLSLIFAAVLIGYLAIYHPTMLEACLNTAGSLKSWITNTTNTGISAEYNIWLKFLIQEQQLVFMFFVIIMRLIMALIWSGRSAAFGRVSASAR